MQKYVILLFLAIQLTTLVIGASIFGMYKNYKFKFFFLETLKSFKFKNKVSISLLKLAQYYAHLCR